MTQNVVIHLSMVSTYNKKQQEETTQIIRELQGRLQEKEEELRGKEEEIEVKLAQVNTTEETTQKFKNYKEDCINYEVISGIHLDFTLIMEAMLSFSMSILMDMDGRYVSVYVYLMQGATILSGRYMLVLLFS